MLVTKIINASPNFTKIKKKKLVFLEKVLKVVYNYEIR